LVERVLRHWTNVAVARRFPRPDEIDPWIVGDDWANCLPIAVQSPVELSHFVAVGENLAVTLCSKDTLAGLLLLSYLPRVLRARRCLIVEGGATHRGVPVLFRGALDHQPKWAAYQSGPLPSDIRSLHFAPRHNRLRGGPGGTRRDMVKSRWASWCR
jgi:hypothetical protein